MNAWKDREGSPRDTRADEHAGGARAFRVAVGRGMTITALLLALAAPAQARGDGFDAFLDGGDGVPAESSVLVPTESPETLAFGDGLGTAVDEGYESSAIVGGAGDGRVVYPGAEPGFIPYGGGAEGGFGAWYGPANVGRGLFLPVSPRWIVQTDALFLWQGNIGSRPLYLNDNVTTTVPNPFPPPVGTPTTALDINQTANEAAAGPRIGVILNLDNVYSVEGNYFNVRPFNGEQSTPHSDAAYGMNNIAGFGPPPGLQNIDWAQVTTDAAIQSAELNWRRRTCGPVTWLAGFRWVEWNQNMQLLDHYRTTAPGGPTVDNAERFNVATVNDLYGGQGGADVMLWNNGGPIRFNAVGKAGVFYNTAGQTFGGFSGTTLPTLSAAAQQTAFFGELGIFGTWQMTDWLAWRTGYNFFWLSGVAVPVDQLAKTDIGTGTATIDTNGSVFLNGVQFGLESRW